MSGPIQRFYQVLAPANHYFILSHEDSEAGPLSCCTCCTQPTCTKRVHSATCCTQAFLSCLSFRAEADKPFCTGAGTGGLALRCARVLEYTNGI